MSEELVSLITPTELEQKIEQRLLEEKRKLLIRAEELFKAYEKKALSDSCCAEYNSLSEHCRVRELKRAIPFLNLYELANLLGLGYEIKT